MEYIWTTHLDIRWVERFYFQDNQNKWMGTHICYSYLVYEETMNWIGEIVTK